MQPKRLRAKYLVTQGAIGQYTADQAANQLVSARNKVKAAQDQVNAARAAIGQADAMIRQAQAQASSAQVSVSNSHFEIKREKSSPVGELFSRHTRGGHTCRVHPPRVWRYALRSKQKFF